jgi:hypothetical protein
MQELTMRQSREPASRFSLARALKTVAASLLCVAALSQPNPSYAHGGGGGFHGGGFHGGGFHGGGFHGGFHGGRFHGRFGRFHRRGFGRVGRFRSGFVGFGFFPYFGYGYYDYGAYGQPYYSVWYYCPAPAGYYPYVTQCGTAWQTVPAY